MSRSSRGLGGGLLGNHLGMNVPKLVRRAGDPAEPERLEPEELAIPAEPQRAEPEESPRTPASTALAPATEPAPTSQPSEPEEETRRLVIAKPSAPIPTDLEDASEDQDDESDDEDDGDEELHDRIPLESVSPSAERPRARTTPKARIPVNNPSRVGTQKNPYERRDGLRTQKLTFTAPVGLKRDIERFCLDQELNRSEWIADVLQRAMDRARRTIKNG